MNRLSITRRAVKLKGYIIILAALAFAIIGMSNAVRAPLEQAFIAMRDRMHETPASGQVVVVEIDKKTLAEQSWPISRQTHAKLIEQLNNAGATRIGFALDFSSPSDAAADLALAQGMAKSRATIILPAINDQEDGDIRLNYPLPMFQKNSIIGNIVTSGWKRTETRFVGTEVVPGLDTKGQPTAQRLPSFPKLLSGVGDNDFPISSHIDANTIPRISYNDVLTGNYNRNQIINRNVIIGGTATILGNRYDVIGQPDLPAPVLLALAAETLIQGPIKEMNGALPLMLTLGIIILTVFGTVNRRDRISGFAIVGAMVIILPSVVEMAFMIRFPAAPALMAAIGAALGTLLMDAVAYNYHRNTHDAETDLPNLKAMTERRHQEDEYIIVARIEDLLPIETAFGREKTASLLRRIHDHISVNRLGSEVYHIDHSHIAWRVSGDKNAKIISDEVERIGDTFSTGIALGAHVFTIMLTFGIATDRSLKKGLAKARHAADEASKRGLGWQFYEENGDAIEWRATLLGELEKSIDRGDVWLAYQPKFNAVHNTLTGAEALVRWDHPERGNIRTDSFIAVAEAAGRIEKLTMYTLEKAICDISSLRKSTGRDISLAVNLSTKVVGHGRLVGPVGTLLARYGLPPDRLTLELTETAVIAQIDSARIELEALRAMGINLAIDDYGTGQASLSYLNHIPANEIKIDQSFIRDISDNEDTRKIVQSTIVLAHDLGMKVVAEGVESPGAQAILQSLECDELQGYLLGKPMTLGEFVALAERSKTVATVERLHSAA